MSNPVELYNSLSDIDFVNYKYNINDKTNIIELLKTNSSLALQTSNEFNNASGKSVFYVIKVNTDFLIKLFILYSIFYSVDALNSHLFIGIDFEFNQHNIALCQMAFFPLSNSKFIFIYDPNMLNATDSKLLIKSVFTSNIYKISHGGDSLDIPYLFEQFLDNNIDYIKLYTNRLIDTRFLCEYHKIYTKYDDKKCSIYNALLYFDVISKEKFDELDQINLSMGPVQDVNWNVAMMSSFHLKYALYDVIYLKQFLLNIYEKTNNDKLYMHLKYIPYVTRFVYYEKYKITNIINTYKLNTDPLNNYIVDIGDDKTTMIKLFNKIVLLLQNKPDNLISNIMQINYFRSAIIVLFKNIVYSYITNNYTVYKNKKEKFDEKLNYNDFYDELKKYHLNKIISLSNYIYKQTNYYFQNNIHELLHMP